MHHSCSCGLLLAMADFPDACACAWQYEQLTFMSSSFILKLSSGGVDNPGGGWQRSVAGVAHISGVIVALKRQQRFVSQRALSTRPPVNAQHLQLRLPILPLNV